MKKYGALMLGDVVGEAGVQFMCAALPLLRQKWSPDFICLNAENASGGFGLTRADAERLLAAGVDCLSSGNHIWEKKGIDELLNSMPTVLRPHNYPAGAPGSGMYTCTRGEVHWVVLNLQGRERMTALDSPFQVADQVLAGLAADSSQSDCLVLVDFHAESFEEKEALAQYLDGRVCVVAGTHTHIATADERIFPAGTGYIGDLGMCAVESSVIGSQTEACLKRSVSQMPIKMEPAAGPCQLSGALFTIDAASRRCLAIQRITLQEADLG
jgi:metallophosphoesterase (TIGR00282 family)